MTRKEKALLHPDNREVDGGDIETKYSDGSWARCCPEFIDCGEDTCDDASHVGEYPHVTGCRGITCIQCWSKNIEEVRKEVAVGQLNASDKERLMFCLIWMKKITELGRDKPLGDLYPVSLMMLGTLNKVLEPSI